MHIAYIYKVSGIYEKTIINMKGTGRGCFWPCKNYLILETVFGKMVHRN